MKRKAKPKFEMYDILEIDYKDGQGWLQYVSLKSESEFNTAVGIVNGGTCYALPHWVARTAVSFRIVSDRGIVKLTEKA